MQYQERIKNKIEEIQAQANSEMEKIFQSEFEKLFEQVCNLYPKRDIKIMFGNGSMIITGFDNLRVYTGLCDSYGNLVGYEDLQPHIKRKFKSNHPLIKIMQLMDVCYYPENGSGWCMALNDLKHDKA